MFNGEWCLTLENFIHLMEHSNILYLSYVWAQFNNKIVPTHNFIL